MAPGLLVAELCPRTNSPALILRFVVAIATLDKRRDSGGVASGYGLRNGFEAYCAFFTEATQYSW